MIADSLHGICPEPRMVVIASVTVAPIPVEIFFPELSRKRAVILSDRISSVYSRPLRLGILVEKIYLRHVLFLEIGLDTHVYRAK